MYEALITALAGLALTGIGWLTSWLRGKTKSNIILSLVTAIEKLDDKEVKALVEKISDKVGVKTALDKILSKLGFLTPLILVALVFSGCGLFSSGTSGLAGEAGSASATGNFYLFNLDGPATVAIDEEGKVVVKSTANGGEAETLGAGIILNVGREAISAKTSSGGGGTGANQEGGSGDVTPSLVLPGSVP